MIKWFLEKISHKWLIIIKMKCKKVYIGARQRQQTYVNGNVQYKRSFAEATTKKDNKRRMLQNTKTEGDEYNDRKYKTNA